MSAPLATKHLFDKAAVRAEPTGADSKNAAAVENRASLVTPARLGTWRLESLLREGSLTRIYRARPAESSPAASLQTPYVVKVLREVWHDHPGVVARIRQEAMVGRCVAHRHVMPVLSAHVHRPPYYVVLPWLPGTNVAALLAKHGRMGAPFALWISRQTAQALEAMHTAGYVHGDVKPGNLLLNAEGHVTLLNLSCARRTEDEQGEADSALEEQPLLGTPKYLAPEIFSGRAPNRSSDLHSLGLTLYEMLAGRLPAMPSDLPGLAAFKRGGAMPDVRTFAPQTPREIAELVRSLLARDPLRRPDTARDLVHRLMRLEILALRQRVPL